MGIPRISRRHVLCKQISFEDMSDLYISRMDHLHAKHGAHWKDRWSGACAF